MNTNQSMPFESITSDSQMVSEQKHEESSSSAKDSQLGPKGPQSQRFESFEQMGLSEALLRGIYAYGWEKPSDIQQRATVPVIQGLDVIAQAQSGRGKTGSFSIASLRRVQLEEPQCQILILSPTRELAHQSYTVICRLGLYIENLSVHKCVGGTSVRDDIRTLKAGRQIVVGTPGRVNQMIEMGALSTKRLAMLCLDEADEMLSCGFKEQVYAVFQFVPADVQVALFSATMPVDVLSLTQKFMRNPVRILVKNDELTLDGIKQYYVAVEREDYKLATLIDLYQCVGIQQAIIFVSARRKAIWLQDQMRQNDFGVGCIHGAMTTAERSQIMKEFRSGTTRVLISTDLLARGIDVQSVSLVINYDLPRDKENYIHRIGRSGRYGRKGVAINFCADSDEEMLRCLEKFYSTKIKELPAELEGVISN